MRPFEAQGKQGKRSAGAPWGMEECREGFPQGLKPGESEVVMSDLKVRPPGEADKMPALPRT